MRNQERTWISKTKRHTQGKKVPAKKKTKPRDWLGNTDFSVKKQEKIG